jgi:hypothetical protein
LTKENSSYGNKPFPAKKGSPGSGKPCYAESPFFMERELATLDDWNPDTLVARSRRLSDWALRRWSVPADVQAVPADQGDVDEDLETDEAWA